MKRINATYKISVKLFRRMKINPEIRLSNMREITSALMLVGRDKRFRVKREGYRKYVLMWGE